MEDNADKIATAFKQPEVISAALSKAVREALRKHKQAGNPVVVWREGEAVWLPPSEIPDLEEDASA